jgi:hypothetical protein
MTAIMQSFLLSSSFASLAQEEKRTAAAIPFLTLAPGSLTSPLLRVRIAHFLNTPINVIMAI